jgi:hypothetical protein
MNEEAIGLLPRFIKDLNRLQPEYSPGDRIWRLPMRTGAKPNDWAMTHVTHYQDSYYFAWTASKLSLELNAYGKAIPSAVERLSTGELKKLTWALKHFSRQVERIENDWVGVYRETLREYPLNMRYGIVPKSVIWKYYADTYRPDAELGKARIAEFITLVRAGKFREEFNGHHKKMTLALFMRYCKLAYLANPDKRFADGRDEGLSGLAPNSERAFSKWYRSGRGGGHPWEIYRGGNTTHIDLGIVDRHQGWSVFLRGSSTGRMVETVRIALALVRAGLAVEIHDADELMLRLLGMDHVGLIPTYLTGHRAAQDFDKQDQVFDCTHLGDLPRNNRILPFITWKPLKPLRPLTFSFPSVFPNAENLKRAIVSRSALPHARKLPQRPPAPGPSFPPKHPAPAASTAKPHHELRPRFSRRARP